MAASDFAIVAPRMADDPREVLDLAPYELRAALTPRTRKAAALLGRYFRDEGGFDFTAFARRDASYVWRVKERAAGACGFERMRSVWRLRWVWIHPFLRRRGLLHEAWPWFRLKHGDFIVDRPLSAAMEAFLRKRNEL
jgi:hypothetical protein